MLYVDVALSGRKMQMSRLWCKIDSELTPIADGKPVDLFNWAIANVKPEALSDCYIWAIKTLAGV